MSANTQSENTDKIIDDGQSESEIITTDGLASTLPSQT